jgi:hypothetical protein
MNMVGNLFGAMCPIVVGKSLELFQSWTIPIGSVAGFYLLAFGCWFLIDPKETVIGPREPDIPVPAGGTEPVARS